MDSSDSRLETFQEQAECVNKRAKRLKKKCAERERKANCKYLVVAENLQRAFEFVFGCWHRDLSRPFTLSGWTYEVCLNCGKKFAYDRADIGCNAERLNDAAF